MSCFQPLAAIVSATGAESMNAAWGKIKRCMAKTKRCMAKRHALHDGKGRAADGTVRAGFADPRLPPGGAQKMGKLQKILTVPRPLKFDTIRGMEKVATDIYAEGGGK